MVISIERGANNLHMVHLMPPRHLSLLKNPEWFCLAGAGLPRLLSLWKILLVFIDLSILLFIHLEVVCLLINKNRNWCHIVDGNFR